MPRRQNNAPVRLGQNSASTARAMLLSREQCSCRQNNHATVDDKTICSGRHGVAPVDKTMLLSTKRCSCRQSNAPVRLGLNSASAAKTMLLSTKPCSCRRAMLLPIKQCTYYQDHARFAKTVKAQYSCGHAIVDETMLRSR